MYENIYLKYKKLKHENKSLKSKLADHELVENQSNKDQATLTENDCLKSENVKLANKIAMLELDVESLTDKLSSYMHEVEDLKYTLARFVKGKNTLDSMLWMKTNFQRKGLGYTPLEVHSSKIQDHSPTFKICQGNLCSCITKDNLHHSFKKDCHLCS